MFLLNLCYFHQYKTDVDVCLCCDLKKEHLTPKLDYHLLSTVSLTCKEHIWFFILAVLLAAYKKLLRCGSIFKLQSSILGQKLYSFLVHFFWRMTRFWKCGCGKASYLSVGVLIISVLVCQKKTVKKHHCADQNCQIIQFIGFLQRNSLCCINSSPQKGLFSLLGVQKRDNVYFFPLAENWL